MTRGRLVPSMALLLAAVLAMGGCSNDSTKPDNHNTQGDTPSLEGALGGLTAGNESPAFGDPGLASSVAAEAPANDAMCDDPMIVRWASGDSARTYALTLTWGILASDPAIEGSADSGGAVVTDWSGHLSVNRGGVVVRSTIAFEFGDHVIRPRTDRRRVDWISHTSTSFDGLRILIHQPMREGETGDQDSLTVVAGTHTWVFLVNDLAAIDRTDDVDDLGNKFSIQGFIVGDEPGPCARGFLGGVWNAPADPESLGTFQGRWVSRFGQVSGFVRGHYGINDQGHRVLFGKYVDEAGTFQGFLRGTWEQAGHEGGPHHGMMMRSFGMFHADLLDADQRTIGDVRGHWRSTPGGGDGFFEGKWAKECDLP